ncbi:MAG: hypothetical protein AB7Q81_24575 [Gammaproteobacteria bacterium]
MSAAAASRDAQELAVRRQQVSDARERAALLRDGLDALAWLVGDLDQDSMVQLRNANLRALFECLRCQAVDVTSALE